MIRDEVLQEHLFQKYKDDEQFRSDVKRQLPVRIENTLHYTRNKLLGPVNTDRDSFDPTHVLSQVSFGDQVIFMDSNADLPADWMKMFPDFHKLRKNRRQQGDNDDDDDAGSVVSTDVHH